jgi:Xaa-Pro aminopeptidase
MFELSPLAQRCAERRQTLAQTMLARGGGVAIVMTAPEVARNRDTEYPFRWDSYFYYLSAFPEPQSALVMRATPHGLETLLFCREKNLEREIWDGFRFGPEQAKVSFGVDACYPIGELDQRMPGLLADAANVFAPLASSPSIDERMRGWLQAVRAQARSGISAPKQVIDVTGLIDEMRLRKDALELATMQRAASISAAAHRRAMQATRPGLYEYEVEAELLHEFRKHGSQFPAYGSIVAGGANACVLHYRENNQRLDDGTLLLIDAGCELDGYASDITRTFPVNGRFSKAQQALYEVVLAAQQAAVEITRPGSHFMQPHEAAVRVLTQGLVDLGLIEGPLDDAIAQERYKRFYMHRTGHWLGMDVHDCGDYHQPTSPPHERAWRVLEPGMVMTIEPGLYVQAASDVDERYHGIGIRIEDDAVVTDGGCQLITREVPVSIAEIEALMRR